MPLVIIKEFETESVIKGYHAYMNDWAPILGENLSTYPEPENEIDRYAAAVTKDARMIGHLKKGKTGWYPKTVNNFFVKNIWTFGLEFFSRNADCFPWKREKLNKDASHLKITCHSKRLKKKTLIKEKKNRKMRYSQTTIKFSLLFAFFIWKN